MDTLCLTPRIKANGLEIVLAEAVRFELTKGCPLPVFKFVGAILYPTLFSHAHLYNSTTYAACVFVVTCRTFTHDVKHTLKTHLGEGKWQG